MVAFFTARLFPLSPITGSRKTAGEGRGAKINYIGVGIGVAGSITKSFCHRSLSVAILSGACLPSSKNVDPLVRTD